MASVDMGTPSSGVGAADEGSALGRPPLSYPERVWTRGRASGSSCRRRGTSSTTGRRDIVTTTDAVVIGSGPNGLVAANLLADAGWSVIVLEEQDTPGGAVRSDEAVQAGYVHDTFSSFYPLALGSPTIRDLHLEEHGLRWVHAPSVVGHSFPDGRWAVLHRDRDRTAAGLED